MIITGIILYYFESRRLYDELSFNSKLAFKRLINSLKEPLWNIDYKEVTNIVLIEMENEDVLGIEVFNEKNEKIAAFIKDKDFNIIKFNQEKLKKVFLYYENDIIKDEIKIGFLRIYFTDYFLKKAQKNIIAKLIFQTLFLSLITIITIYIAINRQIIDPIIQLNRTVGKFTDKDFKARIEIKSNDEIGSLANNFNNMADTIQKYSETMEELVAQRTEQLRISNQELKEANEQMKKELLMAQKIQEALIPKIFPDIKNFSFSGMYIPMESLGGDYYDVIKISENKIGMLIVDVCGHGVPAALITAMAKVSFGTNIKENKNTSEIIKKVNEDLYNIIGKMEYLTAFFCIIDTQQNIITYTNAGHPSAFIIRKEGDILELSQNSTVIGFLNNVTFIADEQKIEDGDKIVLYTDGVIEAKNKKDELFDIKRLKDILFKNKKLDSKNLIRVISNELMNFTEGRNLNDDITILIADFFKKQEKMSVDVEIFSEKI